MTLDIIYFIIVKIGLGVLVFAAGGIIITIIDWFLELMESTTITRNLTLIVLLTIMFALLYVIGDGIFETIWGVT